MFMMKVSRNPVVVRNASLPPHNPKERNKPQGLAQAMAIYLPLVAPTSARKSGELKESKFPGAIDHSTVGSEHINSGHGETGISSELPSSSNCVEYQLDKAIKAVTSTKLAKGLCSYMDLPRELRDLVYHYIWTERPMFKISLRRKWYGFVYQGSNPLTSPNMCPFLPNFLLTSKPSAKRPSSSSATDPSCS
ncbi:hypothetical protein BCR34DRAFT_374399 [Clohesyomyces aquaticus]|uniref:Uncharacterized protein n=1 Tax=Clohesyomyces aquaticus TaxID=1231657 RepID=A0A1Y1ZH10_9PLEO|nr:hypothetical protein BCR34DRAFT_374399 [Clohesyomyces aquaticus]